VDARPRTGATAAAELAELSYEHSVRALDSQGDVLSELRGRATQLITVEVAVATVLGALLLHDDELPRGLAVATVLPLIMLALGVMAAAVVLRPTGKLGETGRLVLVASARAIMAIEADSASGARARVAEALEDMWDENQPLIERLIQHLRHSTACLMLQVASWVILLLLRQVTT
jgi:hypothetical protein